MCVSVFVFVSVFVSPARLLDLVWIRVVARVTMPSSAAAALLNISAGPELTPGTADCE